MNALLSHPLKRKNLPSRHHLTFRPTKTSPATEAGTIRCYCREASAEAASSHNPLPGSADEVPSDPNVTKPTSSSPSSSKKSKSKPQTKAKTPDQGEDQGKWEEEAKTKQNDRSEEDNILNCPGVSRPGFLLVPPKRRPRRRRLWGGFIKHFNRDLGPAPRHVPDHKIYQGQDEFKDKIKEKITEEFGKDDDEDFRLAHSIDVAKDLFNDEDNETKQRVHEKAEQVYQARREAYEKLLAGEGLTSPEDVPLLREQMPYKVQPLINALSKSTDTFISVTVIGYNKNGNEDKAFLCNMLAGTTPGENPMKFDEWDPVGFKMLHVRSFAEFVKSCSRMEKDLIAKYEEEEEEKAPDEINKAIPRSTLSPTWQVLQLLSQHSHLLPLKSLQWPLPPLSIESDLVTLVKTMKLPTPRHQNSHLMTTTTITMAMMPQILENAVSSYSLVDVWGSFSPLSFVKELDKEEAAAKQRLIALLEEENDTREESGDDEETLASQAKGKAKAGAKRKRKGKAKQVEIDTEMDAEESEMASQKETATTPTSSPSLLPPSQPPQLTQTVVPDTDVGARVTASAMGFAQASATALISQTGDSDVVATAQSSGGATSCVRASARGAGQRSDSITSSTVNIDTHSATPSPAKAKPSAPSTPVKTRSTTPMPYVRTPLTNAMTPPSSRPPTSSSRPPTSSSRPPTSSRSLRSSLSANQALPATSNELPSWVQGMKEFLLADVIGSGWVQAVQLWEDLERSYDFTTPTQKTLPTKNRPDAVLFWSKRARKCAAPPDTKDAQVFGDSVVEWWNTMMPCWRTKDDKGNWAATGEGDWGGLRCPGLNGLLSIMACLKWWLISECGGSLGSLDNASSQWQALFNDVCWVLKQLRLEEEVPARKKARL
ncbi:SERTA domain-containing protein 3 [Paramarasmius palmivorus]|uniref:SERTA domain-containing protein 3 n=1 Tax=Paramarasmius palmivorus TaxID=297713 RepID=A0AAW0AP98_9AGAR